MIDIDELERLAKAALSRGEEDCVDLKDWFSQEEFMSNMLLHPVDARFAEGCSPAAILALTAEVRRLRADLDGAVEMANKNALDASRWQHIYHGPYVICRIHADGRLENLGGSYVGKYAVDDGMAARAAHPKEGV